MLEVKYLNYNDLTKEEKEDVPNNGTGKEYAGYIKVIWNGKMVLLKGDAMEPEDTSFRRDLNWIIDALKNCYLFGREDGEY